MYYVGKLTFLFCFGLIDTVVLIQYDIKWTNIVFEPIWTFFLTLQGLKCQTPCRKKLVEIVKSYKRMILTRLISDQIPPSCWKLITSHRLISIYDLSAINHLNNSKSNSSHTPPPEALPTLPFKASTSTLNAVMTTIVSCCRGIKA